MQRVHIEEASDYSKRIYFKNLVLLCVNNHNYRRYFFFHSDFETVVKFVVLLTLAVGTQYPAGCNIIIMYPHTTFDIHSTHYISSYCVIFVSLTQQLGYYLKRFSFVDIWLYVVSYHSIYIHYMLPCDSCTKSKAKCYCVSCLVPIYGYETHSN